MPHRTRTIQDLVVSHLLLDSAGEGSSLLVRGVRALGSFTYSVWSAINGTAARKLAVMEIRSSCVRRIIEIEKERATMGETAARRAAAKAERCKNILSLQSMQAIRQCN